MFTYSQESSVWCYWNGATRCLFSVSTAGVNLNLIKENFTELLADTTGKVQVEKNANMTMLLETNGFRFVDIIMISYPGPSTSYEK